MSAAPQPLPQQGEEYSWAPWKWRRPAGVSKYSPHPKPCTVIAPKREQNANSILSASAERLLKVGDSMLVRDSSGQPVQPQIFTASDGDLQERMKKKFPKDPCSLSTIRRARYELYDKHCWRAWDVKRGARIENANGPRFGRNRGEADSRRKTTYQILRYDETLSALEKDPRFSCIIDPQTGSRTWWRLGRWAGLLNKPETEQWNCAGFLAWRPERAAKKQQRHEQRLAAALGEPPEIHPDAPPPPDPLGPSKLETPAIETPAPAHDAIFSLIKSAILACNPRLIVADEKGIEEICAALRPIPGIELLDQSDIDPLVKYVYDHGARNGLVNARLFTVMLPGRAKLRAEIKVREAKPEPQTPQEQTRDALVNEGVGIIEMMKAAEDETAYQHWAAQFGKLPRDIQELSQKKHGDGEARKSRARIDHYKKLWRQQKLGNTDQQVVARVQLEAAAATNGTEVDQAFREWEQERKQ